MEINCGDIFSDFGKDSWMNGELSISFSGYVAIPKVEANLLRFLCDPNRS